MKTSQKGINLIKSFEGFSHYNYFCPGGYKTIGYGHVVKKDEKFIKISKKIAENLLKKDVLFAEEAIYRLVNITINQNQFDSLVSFIFNIGSGAFQRSTIRKKINREEIYDASEEFLKWIKSGGLLINGLILRRKKERELFLS